MNKKRRITAQRTAPIEKFIISLNMPISDFKLTSILKTIQFPATITGLRWNFATENISVTAIEDGQIDAVWFIYVSRDGISNASININWPDQSSQTITSSQNVLAHGTVTAIGSIAKHPAWNHYKGQAKTARKLKAGDDLLFITLGTAANAQIKGTVQFFLRS